MRTIQLTFAAAVLLIVGYILYEVGDLIPLWSRRLMYLAGLGVRLCGVLLALVVLVACLWLLRRQSMEHARQRDGAFALREYWLEPLPRRVWNWLAGRPSARGVLDMSANLSHAAVVRDTIYTMEPPAGWDRQLAYAHDVERTRRAQAVTPGDGVLGLPWYGGDVRGGIANAATGRLVAGAWDRTPKPPTIEPSAAPMLPPPADLSPAAAVGESRPAALVLGQADGGDLVRWDLAQTPHLRFHGSTQGAGKTNAIQVVTVAALRTGAHVVVCDRVGFKDWTDFARCAELVDTADPALLADVLARLLTIYHNRTGLLAKAGARNIGAYRGEMQRIVVVISEFGAQMATARGEGMGADVEAPLVELARLAGATGIHIVAEDQAVRGWPRELTANLIPIIGRMPLYAAQACGWQGRGSVTPETFARGTFWFGGRTFAAPHMEPELRGLLATVPAPRHLVMLTPPWGGVRSGVSSEVFSEAETQKRPETPPPPTPANGGNGGNTEANRWDDFILDYMQQHPELWRTPPVGVRELARAMSRHDTGNDAAEDSYVGIASKTARRFREEARLPGGGKLGTDITGGA